MIFSHQEGVMDTGKKMGLVVGDGGVKLAKLGSLYSCRTVWVRSMNLR